MDKATRSGKYLIKNPLLLFYLKSADFVLSFIKRRSKQTTDKKNQRFSRILISNIAHMGDCVLSTSILPSIIEKFPEAKIGFLIGEWNKTILNNHPSIMWRHFLNHPLINRHKESRIIKLYRFLVSFGKVVREINRVRYDIVIDLQAFYPNSIFFLYFTNIPRRVGYSSAGFSPLLTDAYDWEHRECHITSKYFVLLKALNIDVQKAKDLKGFLPHLQSSCISLKQYGSGMRSYVVFHPFSGECKKDWKIEKWRDLAIKFQKRNCMIICTGKGKSQREQLEKYFRFKKGIINLCDQLSFEEFSKVIMGSKLVVSVDTVAIHLSAAFNVPLISLHSESINAKLWGLNNVNSKALYEKSGGVNEISIDRVYTESLRFLKKCLKEKHS